MCLILFAHQAHPDFALVLAANRDEFFARPTAAADYWKDAPGVLGGRDLEKGGTWMGVTRNGRWSAVTNYRDGTRAEPGSRSRGELVARYLVGDSTAHAYAGEAARRASGYHGFNLLAGDAADVHYVAHAAGTACRIEPGFHGLSNHLLNSAWPKVERGKQRLQALLASNAGDLEDALFALLADRKLADDHMLPQTGIGRDWEKQLSASFIVAPGYGTRASSVLLIGTDGDVRFRERSFTDNGVLCEERAFRFTLAC